MLKITSANYNVQNAEDEQYNVTASINVSAGKVQYVNSGNVYDRETGVRVAEFHNNGSLSVTFHDGEATAILTAINDLVAEATAQFTAETPENV